MYNVSWESAHTLTVGIILIPYSLKFSRLKNFAVFAGCTLTTKILSRKKFSTGIRIHALKFVGVAICPHANYCW